MKNSLLICFVVFSIIACNNSGTITDASVADTTTSSQIENKHLGPNLFSTDSIEFIYHPNPEDQKSFRHVVIKDSVQIKHLMVNLTGTPTSKPVCSHQSKFYLFNNGDVFKTVYVSDSCDYLAYAVNSTQQFVEMTKASKTVIDSVVSSLK